MIFCSQCGAEAADTAGFCPNCGTVLHARSALSLAGQPEDIGRRVVAFLIDIVPLILLSALHFLPVIGWMIYALLHALYWLLRDINGASLGKTVLGSYVSSTAGGPSTTGQRILRNLPLALPGFLGLVPLIGIVFELFAALAIFGLEALLLLTTGRRLGDRLAGTAILRKR